MTPGREHPPPAEPNDLSLTPRRLVAAVGSANDRRTWSGIPFHLLQAGKAAALLDEGLDIEPERGRLALGRLVWNAGRASTGRGLGGFQYSDRFLSRLWSQAGDLSGTAVVSCFQMLPASVINDASIETWPFIDQTLQQLFDYYAQREVIGHRVAEESIEQEKESYASSVGVIVNSEWARRSVVENYGIPRDKTFVVVPGPSLDHAKVRDGTPVMPPEIVTADEPVKLVFVGKEWRRKGLDRLLRALPIARRRGAHLTLTVIGCERDSVPDGLANVEGVDWAGFIDKRSEEDRFISLIRGCHVGCLLSRYEAGGIALREYQALGLPVIGPATGGAPEHMLERTSIQVDPNASDEEIATALFSLCENGHLADLSEMATSDRSQAWWEHSMADFSSFWPYQSERA